MAAGWYIGRGAAGGAPGGGGKRVTGTIFGIQRFSVDDGPGIRTAVYLKGCDMRCAWCHNPESWRPGPEESLDEGLCARCGRCAAVCPAHRIGGGRHDFDREKCDCGGRAAQVCPTGALKRVGETVTAEWVLEQVARDRRYFERSGGGLTVTGGEPTRQPDFLAALLRGAKAAGIGTCLETNGAAPGAVYRAIAPHADLMLIDFKLTDDAAHRRLTGRSNRPVLENIERLSRSGVCVVLRCPIIPGVNDVPEHFEMIARLTRELPVLGYEIMPYHPLGTGKAERVGRTVPRYPVPDGAEVRRWNGAIADLGGREWRRGL